MLVLTAALATVATLLFFERIRVCLHELGITPLAPGVDVAYMYISEKGTPVFCWMYAVCHDKMLLKQKLQKLMALEILFRMAEESNLLVLKVFDDSIGVTNFRPVNSDSWHVHLNEIWQHIFEDGNSSAIFL